MGVSGSPGISWDNGGGSGGGLVYANVATMYVGDPWVSMVLPIIAEVQGGVG